SRQTAVRAGRRDPPGRTRVLREARRPDAVSHPPPRRPPHRVRPHRVRRRSCRPAPDEAGRHALVAHRRPGHARPPRPPPLSPYARRLTRSTEVSHTPAPAAGRVPARMATPVWGRRWRLRVGSPVDTRQVARRPSRPPWLLGAVRAVEQL